MWYHQEVRGKVAMSLENPMVHPPRSCLVLVRPEPQGFFSAQLMGLPDLRATAESREAAVEQLRTMLQGCIDSGQLQAVEMRAEPPFRRTGDHHAGFTLRLSEEERGSGGLSHSTAIVLS